MLSRTDLDLEGLRKKLGGGFKYFLCSSLLREDSQFDEYFSNGLKPPTRKSRAFQMPFLFRCVLSLETQKIHPSIQRV